MMKTSKNYYLESIRGIAALAVFICHLFAQIPEMSSKKNHLTSLLSNWGTESVIIFFILSGLVIHMSFENHPTTRLNFIKNRIVRIYPILIISVLVTLFVELYVLNHKFSGYQFIGNIIPITGMNITSIPLYISNPVIWSLSFEVFFYLFFSIFCISNKRINYTVIWAWLLISFLSIYLMFSGFILNPIMGYFVKVLAFSCIWLVGFLIWKYRYLFYTNKYFAILSLFSLPLFSRLHILPNYYDPLKYFLFAIGSWPFFLYIITKNQKLQNSNNKSIVTLFTIIYSISIPLLFFDKGYHVIVKLLYISLPIIMLLLFIFLKRGLISAYRKTSKIFIYLGKISYSLYLLHFPIIILFVNVFDLPFITKLLFILSSIVLSTYLLEFKFQPYINKRLK